MPRNAKCDRACPAQDQLFFDLGAASGPRSAGGARAAASASAALRAARMTAFSRAMEHCGWTPLAEYVGFPHTGQTGRRGASLRGTGFLELNLAVIGGGSAMVRPPRVTSLGVNHQPHLGNRRK